GVVAVVEHDLDRIIANGLDPDDGDVFLARHDLLLAWRMAPHFGARAFDAQPLGGEADDLPVVEGDFEDAPPLHRRDVRRPGHCSLILSLLKTDARGRL